MRTNLFRTDLPQYRERTVVTLEDDSHELVAAFIQGLCHLWRKGFGYPKLGVMLLDLSFKSNRQLTLDETPQTEAEAMRSEQLMATIDKLNRELGLSTI
ncbi:hypothetical protein HUO07_16720 [Halomonas sp. QX-1]|uniref:DNA polymerase Y-family little finger domain-containing protein n=1 Tax=Vreelandella maris TaxID=2729617 RepID=A0A7Y6RFB1_9GAMM|nr:hypothetical protein [Halomonas maris]NVF15801.1 hypothetical protein [Halomonas maris]